MTEGPRRPTGPGDSPGFLLWRATNRWQRTIVAALAPLELTHVQFVLLAGVWWLAREGPVAPSQRELADHAGTDPMMTSQVLRALEARGHVLRTPDPGDRRTRRLTPTPAGASLAAEAVGIVETADAAFFARANAGALLRELSALAGPDAGDAELQANGSSTRMPS